MKIFNSIQLGNYSESTCQKCFHFSNDPDLIEKAYPGLTAMSSGYASVRNQDGLCNYNQLYLSAQDSCQNFKQRISVFDNEAGKSITKQINK